MEITADALEWAQNDEEQLARFFETPTGRRFLPWLATLTPTLLEAGDTNAILLRTGKVRGYQEALQNILALAHPAPRAANPETASAYPPLEDDAKWNDGQTIEKN